MDPFSYRDGELFAEELPVAQLAERFGTPLYLYSRDALETHYPVSYTHLTLPTKRIV